MAPGRRQRRILSSYVSSLTLSFLLTFPEGKGYSDHMTTDKRLTAEEAAAALGKHLVTIRRMMATGALPVLREGGRVFIPAAAVEDAARRTCGHCGKTFVPERYATRGRFCSDACRWAATYAVRKARHPATRRPGRPKKIPPPSAAPVPDRLAGVLDRIRQSPTA